MTGIAATANGAPIRNPTSFTVNESSTPLSLDDSSGDVGTFNLGFAALTEPALVKRTRGATIAVTDKRQGRFVGVAETAQGSRNAPQIAGANDLVRLAVTRTAQPFVGTLGQAIAYYLDLCGVGGGLSIDPAIAAKQVTLLGWRDNVWIRLKALAACFRFEIAMVGEAMTFRQPRTIVTQDAHDTTPVSWQVSDANLASAIVVNYYNLKAVTEGLVYPPRQLDPQAKLYDGVSLITVGINEQIDVVVALNASVSEIVQPECIGDGFYPGDTYDSAYAVSDSSNHVVTPQEWRDMGGWMRVAIGQKDQDGNWINDTRTLTITIRGGSSMLGPGPFTIGLPTGDGNFEPALRILGTGVTFLKKQERILTGVPIDRAQQDVGATIDCDAISSYGDAYDAASHVLGNYMGTQHSISAATTAINRPGIAGVRPIYSFADFDTDYAAVSTFGAFGTKLGKATFGTFDAAVKRAATTEFDHQAFGNIAGARRYFDFAYYRIRSAAIGRDVISYSAVMDVTFTDFEAVWAGKTFGDFDTAWDGGTFDDFDAAPLAPTLPGGPDTDPAGYLRGASPVQVVNLTPAQAYVMQCTKRVGNTYFVSQSTGSANGTDQDTFISRCDAHGNLIDSMTLTRAGHGTVLDVEWDGKYNWVWLTWGEGGVNDIVRFQYRAGTYTRAQVPGIKTVVPGGGRYRSVQLDLAGGWAAVRDASGSSETYTRVKLTDLRAGRVTPTYGSVTLPVGPPTMQGFTTLGSSLFRYTGIGSGNAVDSYDANLLDEYDWATGTLLNEIDTGDLGRQKDGTYPGDHHEAEGVTLYRSGTGMNVLYVGSVVDNYPNHQYQLWRYVLAKGR